MGSTRKVEIGVVLDKLFTLLQARRKVQNIEGQPKNVHILVNLYQIFKILFFSESCSQGKLLGGGQASCPPVPAAL